MIRIRFDPEKLSEPQKAEWVRLVKRADRATLEAIRAWEEWRVKGVAGTFTCSLLEEIWKSLKDWLLAEVFHNKCAYCETREVRSPYHAEHYRPKGRVRFRVEGEKRLKKAVVIDEAGEEIEHPGYFWLSYNWLNLLPACHACNSALGKNDQFPVKKMHIGVTRLMPEQIKKLQRNLIKSPIRDGVYFLQPEDLNELEEPLLLNPYIDDPQEHLAFGELGIVGPREGSDKGKQSISIYNLDAEELRIARQKEQEAAYMQYVTELGRGKGVTKAARIHGAKAAMTKYIAGDEPYSAAVVANLRIQHPDHEW